MFRLGGSCAGDATARRDPQNILVGHIHMAAVTEQRSGTIMRRRRPSTRCMQTPQPQEDTEGKAYLQVWAMFDRLREEGRFCDAMLVPEEGTPSFSVHKAILAANSPYFRQMFTENELKDPGANGEPCHPMLRAENNQTLEDKYVTPDKHLQMVNNENGVVQIPLAADVHTAGLVVDYMYKRTVAGISLQSAQSLLVLAESLSMGGLQEHCRLYLLQALNPETCLTILHFSQRQRETVLEDAAWKFLLKNFRCISESNLDYLNMSATDLIKLVADDELTVRREEEVCRAVIRWVDYQCQQREQYMPKFLQLLRLGLLSADFFIDSVSSHHSVYKNIECEPWIREAWELLYQHERYGSVVVDCNHRLIRPRVPDQVMFVIGGWSGGSPVSYLETYDAHADRWYAHPDLEDTQPRAYHALVAMAGLVYMLGGFDGTQYHSSVRCLDPASSNWRDVAPMYSQRCYVSACVNENKIYACGGYDGRWRLKSTEYYDATKNQWYRLASMVRRRSDAGCDALHGLVYVVGGFDGDHCLCSAERYDPSTNQWTLLPRMSAPRSGVAVKTLHGNLLAVGGFDGHSRLISGEKYCPVARCWSPIANMYLARSNCTCAVLDDQLFVVGGYNGNVTIADVECYNDETDHWLDVTDMNVGRSALSACAINDPSSVKKFTHHGNTDKVDD